VPQPPNASADRQPDASPARSLVSAVVFQFIIAAIFAINSEAAGKLSVVRRTRLAEVCHTGKTRGERCREAKTVKSTANT